MLLIQTSGFFQNVGQRFAFDLSVISESHSFVDETNYNNSCVLEVTDCAEGQYNRNQLEPKQMDKKLSDSQAD